MLLYMNPYTVRIQHIDCHTLELQSPTHTTIHLDAKCLSTKPQICYDDFTLVFLPWVLLGILACVPPG